MSTTGNSLTNLKNTVGDVRTELKRAETGGISDLPDDKMSWAGRLARTCGVGKIGKVVKASALAAAVAAGVVPAANASAGRNDVLVLGTDDLPDVEASLESTGLFTSVDVFDVVAGTPSLAQLQNYGAVLVYSMNLYTDPVVLGNRLADYYDAGGGVVCMTYEIGSPSVGAGTSDYMQGRWLTGGYRVLARNAQSFATYTLVPNIPGHPLLAGVSSLTTYRDGVPPLAGGVLDPPNTELVAMSSSGGPLVAAKRIGTHRVVDLAFYPDSVSGWDGDGARLMANALLYSMPSADFPPSPFYLQVNSHNRPIGNGDWYSSSDGGNGANYLQIHVPVGWPSTAPLSIDLLSPDLNSGADGQNGNPRDENDLTGTTNFQLYGTDAVYDITAAGTPITGTELTPPGGVSYTAGSVTVGEYARLITLPAPVAPGAYVLRAETLNAGVGGQNGFRVAAGYDADATVNSGTPVINDIDGSPNSGDEVFISTPGQTLEHAASSYKGITFYRFVPPTQPNTLFHNFDFDPNTATKPEQAIRYYSPTETVDLMAVTGGTAGTLGPDGLWNNGGTEDVRVGDSVATAQDGYWKVRTVVYPSNQFNLETSPDQPMFAVAPPQPGLTITKTITTPAANNPAIEGDTITFEIVATNTSNPSAGGGDAYDVVLTDVAPAGFSISSVTVNPAEATETHDTDSVAVTALSTMAPGDSVTFSVELTVDSDAVGPTATNTVSASFENSIGDVFADSADNTFAVNKAPAVGAAQDYSTSADQPVEDTLFVVAAPGLLTGASDPEGGTITAEVVPGSEPTKGTLIINSDGSFTYDPDPNATGADSFQFRIRDQANLLSAPQTVTLSILAVNDDPDAVFDGGPSITTLEDTQLLIDVLANDTDIDGDTLTIINVTPGVGTASAVVSGGEILFTPVADYNGTAAFQYEISDGNGGTDTAWVNVIVTAVNDAPVVNDDGPGGAYTMDEDTPVTVDVRTNDTDVDNVPGDLFPVNIVGPSHGTLVINPDGTVTYTPDPHYFGTDSFTYQLSDGTDVSVGTATVSFIITAVNDQPVANDDSYLTGEDQTLNVPFITGILANDVDVDNTSTSLITTIATLPTHGQAVVHPDGSIDYIPDTDFVGTDSFEYQVKDPAGLSDTGTVTITVGPHNDAPVGNPENYATPEDTPVSGNVLANDTDIDGDATTASLITAPAYGTLTTFNQNGDFTYEPGLDFNGTDTFTYQAFDMYSMSNVVTVTITVGAGNDDPVARVNSYTVAEDTELNVSAPGVLFNDTDADGDTLQASIITNPSNGSLTLNSDGSFVYMPNADFNGTDTFRYRASDGNGGSDAANVTITVTSVGDVPRPQPDSYTTFEDTSLNVSPLQGVKINDANPEGGPFGYGVIVVDLPLHGTLTSFLDPLLGRFEYTPDADFAGTDMFTYIAVNGAGASDPTTVTITVTNVNDDPTAVDDFYVAAEDQTLTIDALAGVQNNDGDVDNEPLVSTVLISPANGTVSLASDGSFVYNPDANYVGTDTFTYQVEDAAGATASATVEISVGQKNDAPVANDDVFSAAEDVTFAWNVLGNDYDPDGPTVLTTQLVTGPMTGAAFSFNSDGTFSYTPMPNFTGPVSFTYQALDGSSMSNIATVTINFNAANDNPTVAGESYSTSENTPLVVSDPGVLFNDFDVDGDTVQAAVVTGPANGTLLLSGAGGFIYTPNAGYTGSDQFTYSVGDGNGGSANGVATIAVTPVPDAPVAVDDSYSTDEDTILTVAAPGVQLNDSDADGDTMYAYKVSEPSHGTVILGQDGYMQYDPDANFNGVDSFTYYVTDGTLQSAPATVTITVGALNDAPVGNDDAYLTQEDIPLVVDASIGVLDNDVDTDNSGLTSQIATLPANGTITLLGDGSFTYTPNLDFVGSDSFTYTVKDAEGDTDTATVLVTVGPQNDAPLANTDVFSTDEDTPVSGNVLTNDTDVDGDVTTATVITGPAHGTLVFNPDGTFTYTPDADFNGTDSFTYQAYDMYSMSGVTQVSIVVNSANDGPTARAFTYTIAEDTVLNVSAPGVLFNDTDPDNDPLQATIITQPSNGTLILNSDGSFVYTPDADFAGSDSFRYRASDGHGASDPAKITINVTAVNDAPIAVDDAYSTNEGSTLTIPAPGVKANDSDPDGDSFWAHKASNPAHGTVVLGTDGYIQYVPAPNFNGTDSFTYYVEDGSLQSAPATVTITVAAENDAPTANDDAYLTQEDLPLIVDASIGLLDNDVDPDNSGLTAQIVTLPLNGAITLLGDGSFFYLPNQDFVGTDTFSYVAEDGEGDQDVATVTITVGPMNDAPVANADVFSTNEDTGVTSNVLINDMDVDGDTTTATLITGPAHGTVTLALDGTFTYVPAADFVGTDTFTYQAFDMYSMSDVTLVTIFVGGVNDAPVVLDEGYSTDEDTVLTIMGPGVLANDIDPDGDTLQAAILTPPSHGQLILNGDGGFVYTPDADWNGNDTFVYNVVDGNGGVVAGTATIVVAAINDAPVAVDDNYSTDEDTILTVAAPGVQLNDSDADGDTMYAYKVSGPSHGTVILGQDGYIQYDPDTNFNGVDSFTYYVIDGSLQSAPATVTITVGALNDTPTGNDDAYLTQEDVPLVVDASIGVLDNDVDPDNSGLTAQVATLPSSGIISLQGDGSFTYTPNLDFVGSDSFTYTVEDGEGDTDTATVFITVGPMNDAPVANPDVYATNEDTAVTSNVLTNDTDVDGDVTTATVITGPGHGTVTMALDGTFTYIPSPDFNGTDTFTYQAYDMYSMSDVTLVTIIVNPVNDPPVTIGENYSTDEDTTLVITAPGVLANDVDPDGDTIQAAVVTNPTGGQLVLDGDGGFVYTPNPDWNGSDFFTYNVVDGNGGIVLTRANIVVNAINDVPVAVGDAYTTDEDVTLTVPDSAGVLINDTDVDNPVLQAYILTGPSHGTLTGGLNVGGGFVYEPDANWNGTDSFTYYASDGTDNSAPVTVTITVVPVNDPPVAVGDSYTTNEDQQLVVNAPGVLSNDSDMDGDSLSVVLVSNTSHGVLAPNGVGGFIYTPNPDYNGTDSFSYKISDGTVESSVVVVSITIAAVADDPVAVDDVLVTNEDTAVEYVAPGVLSNDSDADGDGLSAYVVTQPLHGTLVTGTDGYVKYTPDADFTGTDSYTYRVYDGGVYSAPATVTITVNGVQDAPVADADLFSTPEDVPLVVTSLGVLANDYDPDGDVLTSVLVSNPSHGLLALGSAGDFTYSPNSGFNGVDEFFYMANDGTSNSLVTTVTITVGPVNDAPVASDDVYFVPEGASTTIALPGVLANDTDTDDAVLTATLVNPALHGVVTLSLDGSFTYTPPALFNGVDVFTYQANDGKDQSALATVVINVTPVNGVPVANADGYSTNEGLALSIGAPGVLINDYDSDGDALTAVLQSNPSSGSVAFNGDGSFVYTPDAGFFGTDWFTYQVTDTTTASLVTTVTIQVHSGNDGPVAVDDFYTTNEDVTVLDVAPGVLMNDISGDAGGAMSAHKLSDPLHGTLTLGADGYIQYIPDGDFAGVDSFTYRVEQGGLWSAPATVTITVVDVPDAPVADVDMFSTPENVALVVQDPGVLSNDYDPDGDALSAVLIDNALHGTLSLGAQGGFTYTPNAGFNGEDLFVYMANDGMGNNSAATTVTITVGPVNDAPVASDDVYYVQETVTTTISGPGVLANDTDADDVVLTSTLVTPALFGSVTLNLNGSFVYTPPVGFNGVDSFTYQANDGMDQSNVATVVLNVMPSNGVPVANQDAYSTNKNVELTIGAPGVLLNDFDSDGDALTAVLQDNAVHGSVAFPGDGSFVYTPDTDFFGTDWFTYQVTDGTTASLLTTVTITVRSGNDGPVAVDDFYSTPEDVDLVIGAPGVLVNDAPGNLGGALSSYALTSPLHGSVTMNTDGSFTYEPDQDYRGVDSFTYRINDGVAYSPAATVTILVGTMPDAPIADVDMFSTPEDVTLVVQDPGVLANDYDPDDDSLTAVLLDNALHGTLALGAQGGFTYTPNAGFNGEDLFVYMANDGMGNNSQPTTVTITVGPVNDAPVANDDVYYVPETVSTVIAGPGVLANDTDADDDVLTATLVNPPLYGTVTLNLNGSFTYTPPALFNGVDSFTYQANDGLDQSALATVVINVLPSNGAPVSNPDGYSTNEEEPLVVGAPGVMLNDFDLDGDALTAVLKDNATSGSVALAGDGSFVYTPYGGFFGTDWFTYQVTDGTSFSLVTTVTIQVRAGNDAPVAEDDLYNTNEETTLTVVAPGVLQNDTDEDGDALTAHLVTNPLYGTLTLDTSGSLVYAPNPNYFGQDSFTYRVFDGTLYSDPATVTIDVLPVADIPVANPDMYSTQENIPFVLPTPGVLANDTDADSDSLTALPLVSPSNGSLIFPGDGSFTYTPAPGFNGVDWFTYQVTDGLNLSNVTTVTLNVGAVNDAPVALDDLYNVYEDTSTTVTAPGVLANDTDADDDVLSATLINGPLNGVVTLADDGSFVYTPYANYFGPDSFTYQATDGLDNSNVATVFIDVLPVDDQPLANEDYFVVDENQQLVVAAPGVLGNDSDVDGEMLTAILQAEPPHGVVSLGADGSFIYTPDADFNGMDYFTYQANDGTGSSEVTTATIVVRPRNARPVASDDAFATDEDTALTVPAPGVLANDTDSDDEPLTASLESLPQNGSVAVNADGSFTYTPDPDFSGTDWFTYRAYDQVESSAVAVVTITVRPVNDLPVANNDNYFTQEETVLQVAAPGVLADDTDVDGDALSATVLDSTSSGVLVLNSDGSFIYTPNRDFSGVDSFTYRVSDGAGVSNTATVTITVGVVNDVPEAADDVYSLFEDTAFTASAPGVLANDTDGDGDPLSAQVVVSPVHGALVLNSDGSFTYTPAPDFVGTDSFTYQATDGLSDSNIAMVVLTVLPSQDKPLANGDFYSTGEDQPLVVAAPGVLGNDADADGETLVALLEDNPLHGTVSLAQDGSFVYTPEPGYSGSDAFTYRANDGTENSDKAVVSILITPKNDVPVSVDDLYFTDEDTSLSLDAANGVLANDYDLDGDPLQAVLINQPLHGSVILNSDGSFTYTPQANFNGEDYFTYRAYDTIDYSTPPSRVTIQVTPVQDKPVGVADLYSVPEDKTLTVQAPGLLGNDFDADGEPLTAILVDAPEFGVVALAADGGFVYTADANYFGVDTFTYFANDGTENSDLTTVTLMIGGRNDGPVAVNDLYYANEDTALSIPAPGIIGNDVDDDGDILQAVLITPPLHGTLVLQPSGAFVYTPNADYSGEDRFVYRASDGTTLSNPATVEIIVTEINDLPVLSNVTVTPALYESQTAVLQADLYDADITDTFLVTVNWGDGTMPTVQSYPAGTSRIFLTHLYADDNPSGTHSDTNAVSVTVQDNRGGADTENRQVQVTNLAPRLENVTLTQVIPTGGTARLQGTIQDMGLEDTFALGIWWGDGQAEVHNFGTGGTHTFDYIHTYAVPGNYTVTVGVIDDDTDYAVQYPGITVRNTADLILTKSATPDPASVGELVTYTMIVTNNGPDLARNVILMDTMPSNVDVISANPPFVPADGVLNWFLGDMASGQTVRVDLVVKTRQQGPVQNIATVISDELDPVPANNTASVTTTIGWLPDGPDLQAQAVTLDSICKITDKGLRCKMKFWALVANRGNEMSNACVYSAYLSVDNKLSADDLKLFTKRFTKLQPLQVRGQHHTYKAPFGLTSSGKFLIVVLDEGNLVFEGNETNNIIVKGPLP